MKNIIIVLLCLFMECCASLAQDTSIVWSDKDTVTIAWQHNWKDTAGNPTTISKFLVYAKEYSDTVWTVVDSTMAVGQENPATQIDVPILDGEWIYGIVAVDGFGRQSVMHTSLDSTAIPPGWRLRRVYLPSVPYGASVVK